MRVVGRTAVAVGALVALATLAGTAHALTTLTVDECLARQVKIVGKGASAYARCYGKAARKGLPTDAGCLAKAAAKVGPALDRLETKKVCLVEGSGMQRTNDAAAYAANVDATVGHAAGKCDSAKTKLVATYIATLANCYAKAAAGTGNIDGTCVTKASVRFTSGIVKAEGGPYCSNTGQVTPLTNAVETFVQSEACALDPANPGCAVPTPTPTATPICNNGLNEPGEPCDASAPSAGWGACSPEFTCTDCNCACPTTMMFSADADAAETVLDAGWTGLGHRSPLVSHGDVTVLLACAATSHPCGACTLTGPVANPLAGAGQLDSRRCSTDSSKTCSSDATCAARTCLGGANHGASCASDSECPSGLCPAAGTCAFHDGAPYPVASGGAGMCVLNQFAGGISGTANVDSGEAALGAVLTARIYLSPVTVDRPCPRCSDAGGINDGVSGGTCDDGPRVGLACDANGAVPGRPDFGRTSLDCPPAPATFVGALTIDLDNATDPVTKALTSASPNCTGETGKKCLCNTCNNANAEPCTSNADCPPSGGNPGICGGLRCRGGSNGGSPCTVSSQCPGSTCFRPGEPTKPFGCVETCEPMFDPQCADGDDDGEGACVIGPNDVNCSLASGHAQRGCVSDMDCGGAMNSCEASPRKCFLTGGGSFQPASSFIGTDTLIAPGMEGAPVAGVSHPTLASVFCVGPTSSGAINNVFGLPGPARVTVKGTASTHP